MEPKQQKFSIGYFILALVGLFLLQSFLFAPHRESVSYSEFKAALRKGKVSDLTLDKQAITGTLTADGLEGLLPKEKLEELKRYGGGTHRFVTARVDDPALVSELETARQPRAGRP
jgi:cell division protease FtsH